MCTIELCGLEGCKNSALCVGAGEKGRRGVEEKRDGEVMGMGKEK